MKVLNIHTRVINQPKAVLDKLFKTLATKNDEIWPKETWPAMKFKDGLIQGARGGHGPIRYTIKQITPREKIVFEFTKPSGFNGIHKLEIASLDSEQTKIKHTIDVKTNFIASISWMLGIRWLHDALIEDAFDKIENQFSEEKKKTDWNLWVRILRKFLK